MPLASTYMFKFSSIFKHICLSMGSSKIYHRVMVALNGEVFTWGSHTIAKSESRAEYIAALKAADGGNFEKLIAFSRR